MSNNKTMRQWLAQIEPWWMVLVLLFIYMISILDRLVINMLVVPIQADMGFSDVQMSLLLGPAFALCNGLFGLPLGWAADRYSRRWVVFGGLVFWSLSTMAAGLTRSFTSLFGARMGVGIGEAALMPAAYSLIADKFPVKRMTTAMSIFGMGPKLGSAFAFAVGSAVIGYTSTVGNVSVPVFGDLNGWRLALLLIGAPGLLVAVLCFSFREPLRKGMQRSHSNTGSLADTASNKQTLKEYVKENKKLILFILLGFSFTTMAVAGLLAWMPTYITRKFGMGPKEYGPILSVVYFLGAFSMIVKGVVIDWMYNKGYKDAHIRFYSMILVLTLPAAIIAFTTSQFSVFVVSYAIVDIILLNSIFYVSSTIQLMVPTHLRGQMTGLVILVVGTVSPTLAPTLVASLTDYVFQDKAALGYSMLSVALVSVVLAIICLRTALIWLKPRMEQNARERESTEAREQASTTSVLDKSERYTSPSAG